MGTAFSTSLLGMFLSLIFTIVDKTQRNRLTRSVFALTEKLDSKYYIDDMTLSIFRNKEMLDSFYLNIREVIDRQTETIENIKATIASDLTYSDAEGHKVTLGNAVREILTENLEQSKALKSFSTDLAIELNNGFDETLSRQMQQRIVPLMENVDATTRLLIEHVDQVAMAVSSPATDMLQLVVQELKTSMATIVDEFRSGLSGSATSELERLAESLGVATQAMGDFPKNMESISTTLQVTIEEVKNTISEISNTSANANSTAMRQMQEQITLATTSIGNAIEQVKDVMKGMTTTSQEESNKMIGKLSDAANKMGMFLNETISSLSSSVQATVKNMANDVTNKQADLIALQDGSLTQTRTLLDSFNSGLDRLERMNEYIAGTMNQFQQAQGQISDSTAHLQTITSDMKLATELFNKGQSDYANTMSSFQNNNQRSIDSVINLLRKSGELSLQYVSEFDTIKQGLVSIFAEVQKGLMEYSRTVKASTQDYLDKYTTSLTDTTDKLSSTIQQQNEVVEMLVESMNARKH
jgi:ABC-type transporter Mla subunit MlaD